jgi:uncharacterized protein involved in exopolysaccharide biosynthesis
VLLKHWKTVLGFPLVAAVAAALVSFVMPPKFTATATFVPEDYQELGATGGMVRLASQFGLAVPGAGAHSPEFYADVIQSRMLRDETLLAQFPDPRAEATGDSSTLLQILNVKGDSEGERLENGRKELEKAITVRTDRETTIVSVLVEMRSPALAANVANQIVDFLNKFNLETRQSNARERRQFIEGRLAEAETEMREAEEELKGFLESNRQFRGSPELTFEYERLQRQVAIKQQVYTTLSESYEEARVREVDDARVITLIDRAVTPEKRSSPRRRLNVALALVVGAFVGVFWAFGREFIERARQRDERKYKEFASRWGGVRSEVRSLLRR